MLFAVGTGSLALVVLGLPRPTPQRLGGAAHLAGYRLDRRPLRTVLALVLQHHPHRSFLYLGENSEAFLVALSSLWKGPPGKTGRFGVRGGSAVGSRFGRLPRCHASASMASWGGQPAVKPRTAAACFACSAASAAQGPTRARSLAQASVVQGRTVPPLEKLRSEIVQSRRRQ